MHRCGLRQHTVKIEQTRLDTIRETEHVSLYHPAPDINAAPYEQRRLVPRCRGRSAAQDHRLRHLLGPGPQDRSGGSAIVAGRLPQQRLPEQPVKHRRRSRVGKVLKKEVRSWLLDQVRQPAAEPPPG